MIQSKVFVCGDGLLSHPVAFLFHLDNTTMHGSPSKKNLDGKKLVIADGRSASAEQLMEWRSEVPEEIPFMVLCPTQEIQERMTSSVGAMPTSPAAAIMIQGRRNSEGLVNYHVEILAYGLQPKDRGSKRAKTPEAIKHGFEVNINNEEDCICTDFASLSRVFVSPEAVGQYFTRVLNAMAQKRWGEELAIDPPTGLKYTFTSQNVTSSFTYENREKNKSPGAATITWTIWAFLGQSATANTQYLIVKSVMSLSAGSTYSDNECDRGYGSNYFFSSLNPSGGFAQIDHGPTSGSGSFNYSINVPISYASPLGGYDIWSFSDDADSSASDWACASISSGDKLGSRWHMTEPCDGDDLSGTYGDAFDTWGHVDGLTDAGKYSLQVSTYSAWSTTKLATGNVTVAGSDGWQGARFNGSSCSPGVYWEIGYDSAGYRWNPGFSVDFSSLQP